jgi:hypothetical protein
MLLTCEKTRDDGFERLIGVVIALPHKVAKFVA